MLQSLVQLEWNQEGDVSPRVGAGPWEGEPREGRERGLGEEGARKKALGGFWSDQTGNTFEMVEAKRFR